MSIPFSCSIFVICNTDKIIIMRSGICLFVLSLCCSVLCANNRQLAFPGAEGWGCYATGGRAIDERGSVVKYVTRLDDCSDDDLVEGTLRWALRSGDDTPRTVLFAVSGTIKLTSRLKFNYPNVTMTGQSAPGGGVCISGANIYVCKDNVIIRHLRFRAGDEAGSNYSAIDIENVKHVIIDHCSFSWSMEENVTMYDNDSTTMQWCILSEPLYYSRHKKGVRGYGSQWGGEHSSFHHNLLAHCASRSPRLNGARDGNINYGSHDQYVDTEVANNVIFNWGKKEAVYGGECTVPDTLYTIKNVTIDGVTKKDTLSIHTGTYVHNNLVNNYYKPGPATDACAGGNRWFARISHTSSKNKAKWYVNGNVMEENEFHYANGKHTKEDVFGGDYSSINADNWFNAATSDAMKALDIERGKSEEHMAHFRSDSCGLSGLFVLDDAHTAYQRVIQQAGCLLPRRDAVDVRILAEASGERAVVHKGSYTPQYVGIIDSQNDLKPSNADDTWSAWPDLSMQEGEEIAEDNDGDGIPDAWEARNGLDATDASDGGMISTNGYSHLENYLESIVAKPDPVIPEVEVGLISPEIPLEIVVLPNGHLQIDTDEPICGVSLYDVKGSKLSEGEVSVDLPNRRGVYLLRIDFVNGQSVGRKVVK